MIRTRRPTARTVIRSTPPVFTGRDRGGSDGLSGLAGSVAVLWLSDPTGATVGASTAVFGLFGALLIVGLKVGGDVRPILTLLGIICGLGAYRPLALGTGFLLATLLIGGVIDRAIDARRRRGGAGARAEDHH